VETRRIGTACWIAIFEDVTTQRENESNLLSLATRDPLTGLANRARFAADLETALTASAPQLAILLLDLDRFKDVNDTLGHPAGDALLCLVSQRLQSAVRESDLLARLGGDEFAILIVKDPLPDKLSRVAARVVDLIQRTYLIGGQVVNIGTSLGIAIAPRDGSAAERLMKCADLALYQAKSAGRNRFQFFEPSMEERSQTRRNLELDLRKALPLRQIEVHYKPRVDLETKSLRGFRAEIVWRHPVRGLMEWEEFGSLSDDLGLTVQIYDWAIRTALRDSLKWPASIAVSVAACTGQFEKEHLVQSVKNALQAAQAQGSRLEISITEDILWRNEQNVLTVLHRLRALGVKVAMDNFGIGYASLRQLAIFPFDRVNIDSSLLADRSGNARHQAIVKAIAALGASLGVSTIVEGIETSADLDRIHSEGCESVHGYLPGKSVSADELPALIASLSPAPSPDAETGKKDNDGHRSL
jgi:diguanylate cyclase (GGDEF)-like protein